MIIIIYLRNFLKIENNYMKTLSIIAPCFNEEKNIKPFYERLSKSLKKNKYRI